MKNVFENWLNKKLVNYLENNIEVIIGDISDVTIKNYFNKARDSFIEARHLKKDYLALKAENEELKKKLEIQKEK